MRGRCPHCNAMLVAPAGPSNAKVLLVGEFPGHNEIRQGRPFVGWAGDLLKKEMGMAGLQYTACRVTNLWQHGKSKDEDCLNWNFSQCVDEMKGRRAILLMGSDCANAFLEDSIMNVAGTKVKSPYFPKEVKVIMAAPNPAILLHDTVGEFRLALNKFAKETKKL